MIPMHYGTFRLGREPMAEPLPRLLAAARKLGVAERVHPLAEGETWILQSTANTTGEAEPALSAAQ